VAGNRGGADEIVALLAIAERVLALVRAGGPHAVRVWPRLSTRFFACLPAGNVEDRSTAGAARAGCRHRLLRGGCV
jgi:hypothetical protein